MLSIEIGGAEVYTVTSTRCLDGVHVSVLFLELAFLQMVKETIRFAYCKSFFF